MKVELSSTLQAASGRIGDVVYRQLNGQTVVAARPTRTKRKPTKAQFLQQQRFAGAMNYAKRILADKCQRFVYEALGRQQGRRADKILTSDFLTPPVVELIELADYGGKVGDLIRVIASDDVEVVSVEVSIQAAGGKVLEQGLAKKEQGVWRYAASVDAPPGQKLAIIAIAKDRPGNEGHGSVEYS